jgi:hypothetical protein
VPLGDVTAFFQFDVSGALDLRFAVEPAGSPVASFSS